MKKFLDRAKKLIYIISSALFFAMTLMLIIVCCMPHGKTYKYELENLMTMCYVFDGDELTLEVDYLDDYEAETTKFKIINDRLYVQNVETFEWSYSGDINAFEIDMGEVVFKCNATIAIRAVAIIFMVLSGLLLCGTLIIDVLYKKGIIKPKQQTPPQNDINNDNTINTTYNI